MGQQSPFVLTKQLESLLQGQLMYLDVSSLSPREQQTVAILRREIVDARLDVRDYELSETRAEQLAKSSEATIRLRGVSSAITGMSNLGVFSPADVALYTAKTEQIIANLK